MNYKEFYFKAQKSLVDSLVSLWMPGQGTEQKYIRNLLTKEEPLLTEPIFQSIFPWETSDKTFVQHATDLKLLDREFVDSLANNVSNKDYSFPEDRHPYKHQTACWKGMLGKDNKTMVVTSGTGSGKTECFMIPVLQDIMRRNEKDCVQAIFLYPLNALMKSQQQRMDAWCRALPNKITYAIYNGDTEKDEKSASFSEQYYPQLVTRPQIRRTPPQILFTNPTMLNYMMVRKEDQLIIEKSKGKLRWILLDEAHSYTGSSAAELALQLRRALDAFGVTVNQVRFAITSATIGDDGKKNSILKLKLFVSQITGKPLDDIVVIGGKRIIPDLNPTKSAERIHTINKSVPINAELNDIVKLRNKINSSQVLTLDQIVKELGNPSTMSLEAKLDLVDMLGEKCSGLGADGSDSALLPTRAHFFIRTVNGLYACVNDECTRQKGYRLDIGSLTSVQGTNCKSCGSRLLEVASCPSCGKLLVTGEESVTEGIRQRQSFVSLTDDLFIGNEDSADDDLDPNNAALSDTKSDANPFYTGFILGKTKSSCLRNGAETTDVCFDMDSNRIVPAGSSAPAGLIFKRVTREGRNLCPHCGNEISDLNYFRVGSNFLVRILAPILLENAQPMSNNEADVVYNGRKFISFTDSRQGTARSALGLNQDVERNWFRSALYHKLVDLRLNGQSLNGQLTQAEKVKYDLYTKMGDSLPPLLRPELEALEKKMNGGEPAPVEVEWGTISNELENSSDFRKLFKHLKDARSEDSKNIKRAVIDAHEYITALFIDQFGWIPKRANSLENMGLVRMVYPDLKRAKVPEGLINYGVSDEDWQDFLKICVDYVVRGGRHYMISGSFSDYLTQNQLSIDLYPSDSTLRRNGIAVSKWPRLRESPKTHSVMENQGRAVLLLCAGMGIADAESITDEQKALINNSLEEAWNFISYNVLVCTDENNKGYKLNLISPKVKLQTVTDGWVCPVDSVILDTTFKGFSPRISGYLSAQNIARFKVRKKIHYPCFPYKTADMIKSDVETWIETKMKEQDELGVLSELVRNIYRKSPIYIAAEHSAQQDRETLDRYEHDFTDGKLNILSCSTTMEMGVDIGGVSEVVMANVPPKSANYLQRAGRAGRRSESKTLVVTFCPATPVGSNTWSHPDWPITHTTEMPLVKMESRQVVQRHVNAYLFAQYVKEHAGLNINERISGFFPDSDLYKSFLNMLDDLFNGKTYGTVEDGYRSLVYGTSLSEMKISESAHLTKQDIVNVAKIYTDRIDALQKVIDDAKLISGKSNVVSNAQRQKANFEGTNLLTYLAEYGFLPSSGIPTGLVECELDDKGKSPTMHLSQAISSYAPGMQIVKNEWCYEPAGILMKTRYDDSSMRYSLQQCSHCGYATITYGTASDTCPKCGNSGTMRGVQFSSNNGSGRYTEVVEPAGFTIEYKAKATRRVRNGQSLNFIQPVLLEMDGWPDHKSQAKLEMRVSTPESQILFYNKGEAGNGFAFCPYCGRMESEKVDVDNSHPLAGHKHLKTLEKCEGGLNDSAKIRRNVLLVGRYQTDFVEMRFYDKNNKLIKDQATLYSLGVIICRSLTEILGVSEDEVDFGYNNAHDSIFIYDTALGGSGYSPLLRDYRDKVLEKARQSLDRCDCERACTHCLIDRKSQWYINYLDRGKALEWLKTEHTARTAIDEVKGVFNDAVALTSDLNSEVYAITRDRNLAKLEIYLSGDVKTWNPEIFTFGKTLSEAELNGVNVTYILDKEPDLSTVDADSLSSIVPFLMRSTFRISKEATNQFKPLLTATTTSGVCTTYFGTDVNRNYGENWGEGTVFITRLPINTESDTFDSVSAISNSQKTGKDHTFLFEIQSDSSSNGLLTMLESFEPKKWNDIMSALSGKKVRVSYTDRYLHTPLGCYMLAHLLKSLVDRHSIQIESLRLSMCRPNSSYTNNIGMELTDNFCDEESRNDFMTKCFETLIGVSPSFVETGSGFRVIQHDRCLSIISDNAQLSIRPDGGIAYGWGVKRPCSSRFDGLENDLNKDIPLFNRVSNQGILYTIVYKES